MQTLTDQLEYNQTQDAKGLAGAQYEEQMNQENQLETVLELLVKGTPPESIVEAGYSIDIVKMAIQMLSAQETPQPAEGLVPNAPLNEGLAAGIRNY